MSLRVRNVAIFWDYENCPAPAGASGWEIVKEIRRVAHAYGTIKVFRAYLELPDHSSSLESRPYQLRSELQASGVSLTDCPHNGRKDVADKMILVDMMAHAIDNPAPWTYMLISGDRDFAYAISVLGLRQYQVVLMSPATTHISLKSQAAECLEWGKVIGRLVSSSSRTAPQNQASLQTENPHPSPSSGLIESSHASASTNMKATPASQDIRSPVYQDDFLVNTDGATSTLDDVNIIEYLRARRRQNTSRSSESSHSTASGSQCASMTDTAYFSALEGSELSPHSTPSLHTIRGHPTQLDSTHPTDHISHLSGPRTSLPLKLPSLGGLPPASEDTSSPQVNRSGNSLPLNETLVQPSVHKQTASVPIIFQPLVKLLKDHLVQGSQRPSRKELSHILDQQRSVYSSAKVEGFGQYIALAERHKVVTQGPPGIVQLRPEWI